MRGSAAKYLDLDSLFEDAPAKQDEPQAPPSAGVGLDLDSLFAQALPQPAARWAHRGTGHKLYRLRLSGGERRALLCVIMLGVEGEGNELVRILCGVRRGRRLPSRSERAAAFREAQVSGQLRMQRITGTGDYDVLLAKRLVLPLRRSTNAALEEGASSVVSRYRATPQQLDALYEAISPGGLRSRAYAGD